MLHSKLYAESSTLPRETQVSVSPIKRGGGGGGGGGGGIEHLEAAGHIHFSTYTTILCYNIFTVYVLNSRTHALQRETGVPNWQ